ncbi:MAG: SUMF1/EgtB/PvdO family nonheme iron enzyme [Myxococcales bacterium]|nr:SUMF1/EgtB/PvdO family nonheme iron enzyme [Myxococcales bacterium]
MARPWSLLALALLAVGCRSARADASPEDAPAGPIAATPIAEPSFAGVEAAATVAQSLAAPSLAEHRATATRIYEATPPPPCPKGMAHLGRFCVDRYEAHLVLVDAPGGAETPHPPEHRPPEGRRFEARSAAGMKPQAYVSRVEAALACKNADKRLCSFGEWRRACGSRRGKRYPYGWGGKRGACNTGKKHLLHEMFGERPWSYEQFNDPKLSLEPGYLAASGAHPECATEQGVFDMNGNLHEWVSSTVTEDFVERLEEEDVERVDQPWVVGNGMFLGGFYSTTDQHGPGCLYTTIAHEPTYHDYSTGFRCCRDAVIEEPKSVKRAAKAPAP